jgi:signal transduction histidine kinase
MAQVGQPWTWAEDDVALVETVGADLGRVVVHARLFEGQRELVHQLQELDRAKSDMLSTFSHELRTPLASIRAYVELLQEGETEGLGGSDRMLGVIETNTRRLSDLIEDILTLSHLDSTVYAIELLPLLIEPFITSVCEALRPSITAKQLDLVVRSEASCAMVLGDAAQLERLLFNLISNAIKFTPAGGRVEVGATCSPTRVVLTVADTGIGIPPEEQEAVMGRFYRASNATRAVIPGTGLGLAIAEAIVAHHHGTIALSSAVGQGTTVRVILPAVPGSVLEPLELPPLAVDEVRP